MKRLKAEQKRRIAGIIAIVLIVTIVLSAALPLFWVSVNAADNSDYTIEATIGFDGKAKIGFNIPVTVAVTNYSGEDFAGQVSLLVGVDILSFEEDLKYNEYARELELAPGDTGEVTFNVPVRYIQRSLTVELTRGEEILAAEEFPFSVSSDQDCWAGILSESPENLTYLSPSYYGCSGDIVDLSSIAGSRDYSEFNAVNTFIINDFDLAALSDGQLREILDIVNIGGTVIIGSRSRIGSIDRLGLDELVPMTTGIIYSDYDSNVSLDVQQAGEVCTLYPMGDGYIAVVEANFSDSSSVTGDPVISSVLTALFSSSSQTNYADDLEDYLIGYTDRLPNLSDNTIKVIFIILYFYIAFILVLYFILKKKDRREDAVKIIPITAVVLSLAIYLISFNTVYKRPVASVINYIDLRSSYSDTVTVKSFINVIAPFKGQLDIRPGGDPELLSVSDYNYNAYNSYGVYSSGDTSDEVAARVIMGDEGLVIEENDKTKWDNTYLSLAEQHTLEGGFDNSLALDSEGRLTGEITNNTGEDLTETVVLVEVPGYGAVYASGLGEMAAGDVISLDGYDIRPFELYSLGYEDYAYVLRPQDGSRDEDLDRSYRLELEQDIFEGLISYSAINGEYPDSDYVSVSLIGFSDAPVYGTELTVNDRLAEVSPINVFRDEVWVSAEDVIQTDVSDALPVLESPETGEIRGNTLFIYDTAAYTELSFDNPAWSPFTIEWDTPKEEAYIYNSMTNRWEELSSDIIYSPADGYTDDEGKVRIRASGFAEDTGRIPGIRYMY